MKVKNDATSVLTEVHMRNGGPGHVITFYKLDKCQGRKATAFFDQDMIVALDTSLTYDYHFLQEFTSISISKNTVMWKNGPQIYAAYESAPLCISLANSAFDWQASAATKMNQF